VESLKPTFLAVLGLDHLQRTGLHLEAILKAVAMMKAVVNPADWR
jgi:hypothetical protein